MTGTKVSIIIPVYNCSKYLKQCLNSIVNQTLHDIEIILINDGSTDNSLEICKSYAASDKRIILINQENQGVSVARNLGIDIAQGEYLSFADSDDFVDLNYYEKLYTEAKSHNADIAVSGIIKVTNLHKKYHLKFTEEIETEDINEKCRLCDVPDKSYVWNKIYKTDEIKKHNLKFKPGVIFEDVIYTPQVLYYLQKMVTVPNVYYHYIRHKNSLITLRTNKAIQQCRDANKEAVNFLQSHNIKTQQTITKRYKIFNLSVFKIFKKNGRKSFALFNIIKWTI